MAKFEFTIPNLLRAAGIRGYLPRVSAAINRAISASNEPEYNAAMHEAAEMVFSEKPWFEGLPVYMPLELHHADLGNLMLDSALVEVSNARKIAITQLQGIDNTVKEFITNGDYTIKVRGLLAKKGFGWPKEEVELLKEFMRQKSSLEVAHEKLNSLDVFELVVLDWSLPYEPSVNVAAFEFTAVSDEPVELVQNV